VIKAVHGDRLEALYLLLVTTGLRRGEALALRWSDLDGDVVHVKRTLSRVEGVGLVESDPKSTASRRDLALGPAMLRELERHHARQAAERLVIGSAWVDLGLIFTTTIGTHLEPRNVLRDFQRLTRIAGLGSVKLHTLRHSAASAMLAGGLDLATVAEHLGHGSKAVTLQIYSHAMPARRAAASVLLDAQLG
jgi:integrase